MAAFNCGFYGSKISRDQTEKFILLYKERELLWNTRHEKYRHSGARSVALQAIAKTMGPEWTEAAVKSKWNNLKTSYARERRKQDIARKSDVGLEEVMSPRWWLFDMLDGFLSPHNFSKQKSCNSPYNSSQSSTFGDNDDSMCQDSASGQLAEEDFFIKQERDITPDTSQNCSAVLDRFVVDADKYEDHNFILFVEDTLRRITDEEIKDDVKLEIHTLLRQALRKQKGESGQLGTSCV